MWMMMWDEGMGQSVNTNFQAINLLKYESSVEISIFYTWISSKDSYFSFVFLQNNIRGKYDDGRGDSELTT